MESFPVTRRAFVVQGIAAAVASRSSYPLAPVTTPATVRTRDGVLQGALENGVKVFRGVPFAAPPVGDLRFRAPEKPTPWKGVRAATSFASAAMQNGLPGVAQSEDCLYLNLWAPTSKGPHPVFVWIHGGGFTGGYAFDPVSDGTEFAQQGVVCITVAYRLGAFGFLDLEPALGASYAGSANNGLRDLIAALAWVHEHVADFGGDPSRVTIGGESAGAKLTDILMGVPSAQGLFHQVISESGGAERVASRAESLKVGAGFQAAWAASKDVHTVDLRRGKADAILGCQMGFIEDWPKHFPLRAELDGDLMRQLPVVSVAGGLTRGKRLLIGSNREESALFIGPHPQHDATAKDVANTSLASFAAVHDRYRKVYPEMTDRVRRIRSLTAEEYWVPTIRVADAHVRAGGEAWMYQLAFAESSGRLSGYAYHSLDVGLVWDKPHPNVADAEAEATLAKQMHAAWLTFLRGATPAAEGLPTWPEYEADRRQTMVLDEQSRVVDHLQEQELRLWDNVVL